MTTQSLKSQRVREQMAASNRPTMRDVAEAAGVSTATVSNVLHGLRFVGPEKQKRVRDAIARLSYSPNRVAASLRSRRSHMIGVVLPDMTTSFFSAMFRRIEELAADSNYQILLANSQEDTGRELERIQALIARQADGLIVVPLSTSRLLWKRSGRVEYRQSSSTESPLIPTSTVSQSTILPPGAKEPPISWPLATAISRFWPRIPN